jgi:hypothetical protein
MKNKQVTIYILLIIISLALNKGNQNQSKFDKAHRACQDNQCKTRHNDENCVYLCINSECYEQVYGNYLLEFGEYNNDLKNKFEKCYNDRR